jgi:hypothetical protein
VLGIVPVPPDAAVINAEQVQRHRRYIGDRAHPVNVGFREQLVEVTGLQASLLKEAESRLTRLAAIILPAEDIFLLLAPVQPDESPGKVVMDGRLGPL